MTMTKKEHDRKYYLTHKEKFREYRIRNKERINSARRETRRMSNEVFAKTVNNWKSKNKDKRIEYANRYRAKYPEKQRAQSKLQKAVKKGIIHKQSCQVCGNPKTHAHHDDYSKPYNVRWLCPLHHSQWQKQH